MKTKQSVDWWKTKTCTNQFICYFGKVTVFITSVKVSIIFNRPGIFQIICVSFHTNVSRETGWNCIHQGRNIADSENICLRKLYIEASRKLWSITNVWQTILNHQFTSFSSLMEAFLITLKSSWRADNTPRLVFKTSVGSFAETNIRRNCNFEKCNTDRISFFLICMQMLWTFKKILFEMWSFD